MKFRDEVALLLEATEDAIPTIEVKADLLRDFLERVQSAEERLSKQIALLRDREEILKPRHPKVMEDSTWSTIDHIERTARTYVGTEFRNLEKSVLYLKRLFAAVRDGDLKDAEHWVGVMDAGLDDRPWDRKKKKS